MTPLVAVTIMNCARYAVVGFALWIAYQMDLSHVGSDGVVIGAFLIALFGGVNVEQKDITCPQCGHKFVLETNKERQCKNN